MELRESVRAGQGAAAASAAGLSRPCRSRSRRRFSSSNHDSRETLAGRQAGRLGHRTPSIHLLNPQLQAQHVCQFPSLPCRFLYVRTIRAPRTCRAFFPGRHEAPPFVRPSGRLAALGYAAPAAASLAKLDYCGRSQPPFSFFCHVTSCATSQPASATPHATNLHWSNLKHRVRQDISTIIRTHACLLAGLRLCRVSQRSRV